MSASAGESPQNANHPQRDSIKIIIINILNTLPWETPLTSNINRPGDGTTTYHTLGVVRLKVSYLIKKLTKHVCHNFVVLVEVNDVTVVAKLSRALLKSSSWLRHQFVLCYFIRQTMRYFYPLELIQKTELVRLY